MSAGLEIVTETDRLAGLSDEWRALAEERANAFLTPEWFFSWIAVYGDGALPLVAVRRDAAGDLAGVLPLVGAGPRRYRTVRFAGASLGDHFFPLDRDSESEFAVAALRAIRAGGERGAVILDRVDTQSEWVQALARGGEATTALTHLDGILPEVEIAGMGWDEYLAERSRNLRSQIGRRGRRLEREHEVVFRSSEGDRLAADMEALQRLHQGRWAGRGGSGALNSASIEFHARFSAAILERGWLRLWIVEIDGEPAAAWYGWRVGDRYSYYLAGFDQAYSDYSIGTLLLARTIEEAIGEGCSVYEMLLGTEPFKLRFATGERRVGSLILSSRRHPVRLAALGEAAGRRALDRVGSPAQARVKRRLKAIATRLSASGDR